MNQSFLKQVKIKRKLRKLTQEDVAQYLGISRRAYISFENGESNFKSEDRLQKLCDLLKLALPTENESEVKINSKMMKYKIKPKSQLYEDLLKTGLIQPGDKAYILIEEQD